MIDPIAVTAVAGTWGWRGLTSDPRHWTHPASPLWTYLNTRGLTVRCSQNGRGFTWGTRLAGYQLWRRLFGQKPSIQDWEVGAAALYDYHLPPSVAPGRRLRGRNLHMICHSHGGNLPYIAASALDLQINVLATVSTPIRMDVLRQHGEKARKNIGFHVHYWSRGDGIQMAGGLGDSHVGIVRQHPFADANIELPEDAGHTGLLENPFYFDELLTFAQHVRDRNNNPGYLNRLWVAD